MAFPVLALHVTCARENPVFGTGNKIYYFITLKYGFYGSGEPLPVKIFWMVHSEFQKNPINCERCKHTPDADFPPDFGAVRPFRAAFFARVVRRRDGRLKQSCIEFDVGNVYIAFIQSYNEIRGRRKFLRLVFHQSLVN